MSDDILKTMDTACGSILLLDGATGTELGRRGVEISLPLWSARAILDAPEVLEQIHADYLDVGCEAITTNTFRTHRRSLAKGGLGDRARELTERAVRIAQRARDKRNPKALVLGSVAPLEDCYRPDLVPSPAECADEHREMIAQLLDAGVDLLLLETMNSQRESMAAVQQARELAPGKWMVSFCTKPEGPPGVMLRGTPLTDVLPTLGDAYAVGVNCVVGAAMEAHVRLLRALLPDNVRISAYGNSGEYSTEDRCTGGEPAEFDSADPQTYAEYAQVWAAAGASIIGGCCGTTPETMKAVADRLGRS
ncbi:MAG: homocysteine S-methyltransferase family protein [Phycisphaerales bacterium]|nr:MAG: homocysteine S-methyltransferase family protein [Phycisphaerales bacterium]